MPNFAWEGRTRTGDVRKGVMEADDAEAVKAKLRAQNIQPDKVKRRAADIEIQFGSGVSTKELVVFTRQFATMIDAGLPLVQCLDILGSQNDNKQFQKVIFEVKSAVEGGSTFADALGKHPKVFDDLFVNLVAAGEVGGILDTIMNRLAAYIEKAMKLKKRVKSALVYPAIVFITAIGVLGVLLVFVIPKFKEMFDGLGGGSLPAPTQIVIDMSDWVVANLLYIFLTGSAVIGGFIAFAKNPKGRAIIDKVSLKVPLFGPLLTKVAVAKFTRTLGTMLSSGVPILDALDIVSKTAGNKTVEWAINTTREKISEGKNMAEPLAETQVFPSMVVQMIAVGESTGAMDTMLQKIADFYEDEVDAAVDSLTSAIEPLLMVFLGGMVGFFLIAMYMPIFELAGGVDTTSGH